MGLSIYYSGTLRDSKLIDEIIDEASDIAESHHWEFSELPNVQDIPVRGIIMQPEGCDPIWLTFHADGYLCNPILFSYLMEQNTEGLNVDAQQWLVTKTQYAGPETHIEIIRFFHYLGEKYFSRFELNDDSRFWETGDEELCHKRFGKGDKILDLLDIALSETRQHSGSVKQIKRKLRKRMGMRKKN